MTVVVEFPGGDVIHYQDGNNRDDIPLRFTVTTLCEPGQPMLTLVDDEELAPQGPPRPLPILTTSAGPAARPGRHR
ncbi:hypothetical protein [Nonomuraea sediminis]|uniref:hypothetical protein n=1 Tax=Nonomuraea sediminis TaxID=2835864 RepID=UPI001BDCE562|nr:hypothetical protein [Nonomuraea sediminis]